MPTLITGGEVLAPESLGAVDLLVLDTRVGRMGPVDGKALAAAGLDVTTIDARGCLVVPGLVDVHEHLCGGSGEPGFARGTPEIQPRELVRAGITTVVGCLGVDTTTRTMPQLVARAKALRASGLSAWCWTGGYPVPPATLTGTVRTDVMLIDEIIGAGEVAVADERSSGAPPESLAILAREAHAGGLLAGKTGLLHVHVGPEPERLAMLRTVVSAHGVPSRWLYPTHVERSEALFDEAIAFARSGAYVDVDVWERDLDRWLRRWHDAGAPDRLTVSSDAGLMPPLALLDEVRRTIVEEGMPASQVLATVTRTAADALGLSAKGRIAVGADADLLVLDRESLALRDVLAGGQALLRDGCLASHLSGPSGTRLGRLDAEGA
jgi:beta-aspartyl-dipeptidase (metallo-type)